MNALLTICIPTYNRASQLAESLQRLIELVALYDIPIVVSDNASTDETGAVVANAQRQYANIIYHRNSVNVGMDANFGSVLKLSNTRFAWLLGDDDCISGVFFDQILQRLKEEDLDLLVVNGGTGKGNEGRVLGNYPSVYRDADLFLRELGWHSTWISSLIVSREIIHCMDFEKYDGSYFSHFGSLFDALAIRDDVSIGWFSDAAFYPSSQYFSWSGRELEIFAERWSTVVSGLSNHYSDRSKSECMLCHSRNLNLFTRSGLLNLRTKAAINLDLVKKYGRSFEKVSDVSLICAKLISVLPIWPLKVLRFFYLRINN